MSHGVIVSGSLPDLKAPRIKRKPPPSLDISERYPSPDPTDPFAPLWVLRNRTSSGLQALAPTQEVLHQHERRRVDSVMQQKSNPATATLPLMEKEIVSNEVSRHHKPRSQSAYIISSPIHVTNSPNQVPLSAPWPRNQGQQIDGVHLAFESDSGTESESCTNRIDHRSYPDPSIQRSRVGSQNKLARFLMSKKTNSISKVQPTEFGRLRKSSISTPIVSTVVWNARGKTLIPIQNGAMCESPVPFLSNSVSLDTYYTTTPAGNLDGNDAYLSDTEQKASKKQANSSPPIPVSVPLNNVKVRRFSSTQLVPVEPSTRSNSSSSFINISAPSPATPFQPAEHTFAAAPRPAPRPPSPLLNSHKPPNASLSQPLVTPLLSSFTPQAEWATPGIAQLKQAASLTVISESGIRVRFGELFERQPTVVVFIRHFWCPLCQDYISELMKNAHPQVLHGTTKTPLRVVIIGNGSYTMIGKYRQIFGLPISVYTDPSLALYKAMGMGRDGAAASTDTVSQKVSIERDEKFKSEKEEEGACQRHRYVKHGLMGGIAMVVVRAIKVGMPVWEKGGDIHQLGGEFVLGPGSTCTYAHRMQHAKGHAPIIDALKAAGAPLLPQSQPQPQPQQRQSLTIPRMNFSSEQSSSTITSTTLTTQRGASIRKRRESMTTLRSNSTNWSGDMDRLKRKRQSVNIISRSYEWSECFDEQQDQDGRQQQQPQEQLEDWMEFRQKSLDRLREKKNIRRGMVTESVSFSNSGSSGLSASVAESGVPLEEAKSGAHQS